MIRMVQAINGEHLARLTERADPNVTVSCATCHRGITRPRSLIDELLLGYRKGGASAAAARFRELRERYYGGDAYAQREELGLGTLELFDAHSGIRRHLLSVAIGVASIALALVVPMRLFWMPGFIYFLLGPVQGTNGYRTGVARARLKASLA